MVSKEQKEKMDALGVTYTNPVAPDDPVLFGINYGDVKDYNYELSDDELNSVYSFFKNAHTKAQNTDLNIWRGVSSSFYHNSPQSSIETFQNAYWTMQKARNKFRLIAFDIETLGSHQTDTGKRLFTPTEMIFKEYRLNNSNKLNEVSRTAFLVKPTGEVQQNISGLLNHSFKTGSLTSDQYRTLKDLMKYSTGVQIDNNGAIIRHASWVDTLIQQEGTIDFNKTYYINGMEINPLEKAREGFDFLLKHGKDPVEVARNFSLFLEQTKDAYFGGHNVKNFDIEAINYFLAQHTNNRIRFTSDRILDTQQILSSLFQSPTEMASALGISQHAFSNMKSGYMTQEALAEMLDIVYHGGPHVALSDVDVWAELYNKINDRLYDYISNPENNLIKYDVKSTMNSTQYLFDQSPLKSGQRLISAAGANKRDSSTIGFVLDKNNHIVNERNYLMSKVSYNVNNIYTTKYNGRTMYGIELLNEATGNTHIIYKDSLAGLQDFIHEKFRLADNLSDGDIMKLNAFKNEDLARSRYRKLFSTRSGGGFYWTERMLDSVEVYRAFKEGVLNEEEYKEMLGLYLEYKGKPVESMIRDFEYLKDRLDSEYDVLKTLTNEIKNKIPESPGMSGLDRQTVNLKRSIALSNAYKELLGEIGEHKEVIETPVLGKHGFSFFGHHGEELFVDLESPARTEGSIQGILKRISSVWGDDLALQKQFLINMVEEQLGPHLSGYEMQEALNSIRKIAQNQKGTGYAVGEFASFLNKIKHKDVFTRNTLEVESLSPRKPINLPSERIVNIANKNINRIKNLQNMNVLDWFSGSNKFGLETIRELDDELDRLYSTIGIGHAFKPKTMQESLNEFLGITMGSIKSNSANLSMRLNYTGSPNRPGLTLSIFNTSNKGAFGRGTEEIANYAVNIDIPLISKTGYINYGDMQRIAPLVFLDRLMNGEVKVHSAFDRVLYRLKSNMDEVIQLISEGKTAEAQSLVNKSLLSGIQSFSSSNLDDVDFNPTGNMYSDMLKRMSVITTGYYSPIDSYGDEWYAGAIGEKNIIKNPMQRIDALLDAPRIIKQYLGEGVNVFFGSGKENAIFSGQFPLIDIRHDTALGFFNNLNRPNMIQMWNARRLEQLSYKKLNGNSYVSVGALFAPEHISNRNAVMVKAKIVDDATIFNKLGHAFETAAGMPTVYEDQFIMSAELADQLVSRHTYTKTITKEELASLSIDILDDMEKSPDGSIYRGRHKIEYLNQFYSYRDIEGNLKQQPWELQGDHYITEIRIDENGNYKLAIEQEFRPASGSKYFFGTEKGTASEFISQRTLNEKFGEGVSLLINSKFASHGAYGDIFAGYINNAVFELNRAEHITKEVKKRKIEQLSNLVNEIFNLDSQVVEDNGQFRIVYNSFNSIKQIAKEIHASDLVDQINIIMADQGIKIKKDELVLELNAANVDENFHWKSITGEGVRGAKFSAQEVQNIRLKGKEFETVAEWLEKEIASRVDPFKYQIAHDEAKALNYLLGLEEVPDNVKRISNTLDRWNPVRKGGVEGSRALRKGLYKESELEGTILSKNREEFILRLPDPVSIKVDEDEFGNPVYREISEIFIGKSRPELIAKDGTYQLSGLPRKQLNLVEAVQDYQKLLADTTTMDDSIADKLRVAKERIQKAAQGYYDFMFEDLTSNKGIVFSDIYSGRLLGSGGGLLQVMNPVAQNAERLKENRVNIDESLINKYAKYADEPNVVYLGREKALRMVGFNSEAEFEELLAKNANDERIKIIQNMTEGGHHGVLVRYPTIHEQSTSVVKFKIDDNVNPRGTKISSLLAKALFGDSDGDRVAFALAYGKHYNYKQWDKAFQAQQDQLLSTYQGENIEDIVKMINKSAPIEEMFKDQDSVSLRLGKNYDEAIQIARMLNPAYTGYLTNMGMNLLQLGETYLTNADDLKTLQRAVGNLIQKPISGKHLTADGEARQVLENINTIIKSIQTGDRLENLAGISIATKGDEFVFNQKEVDVLVKLKELVDSHDPAQWRSVSADLGLSERISRKGINRWAELLQSGGAPTPAKEMLLQAIGDTKAVENIEAFRQELEVALQQTEEVYNLRKALEEEAVTTTNRALENAREKLSGKLGIWSVLAAAGAGFVAGEMATGGGTLPMDYAVGVPGMAPRRGATPQPMAIPNVMGAGYDINIRARTTINRDIDQLAGIISQSLQENIALPVNFNINATDNRNDISEQWIQQQVLNVINK